MDGHQHQNPEQKKISCQSQHQERRQKKKNRALKGYTKSFEIAITNDPLKQNNETRKAIQYKLTQEMKQMKGLKFLCTISIIFENMSQDVVANKTAYFNSIAKIVFNIFVSEMFLKLPAKRLVIKFLLGFLRGIGRIQCNYLPGKGSLTSNFHVNLNILQKDLSTLKTMTINVRDGVISNLLTGEGSSKN